MATNRSLAVPLRTVLSQLSLLPFVAVLLAGNMQNNAILQRINHKPRFSTGVIVINLVIPIYALSYEFPTAVVLVTDPDSARMKYFKVHRPALYYIYHIGSVACLVDLVVSSLFLTTMFCSWGKPNFKKVMLVTTCVWATWNCLRLLFDVVQFIEDLPHLPAATEDHRYRAIRLVMAVKSATDIALRMVSIPIVVLHYKFINDIDREANGAQQGIPEIRLANVDDRSVPDHGIIRNERPNKTSLLTMRTVLIVANSVPLLAISFAVLPLYTAWVILDMPFEGASMTKPMLVSRIVVDILEILLSMIILTCVWGRVLETKMFRLRATVIWFVWHLLRVILQFACGIWMSVSTEKLRPSWLKRSEFIKWHTVRVVREYFELVIWIICIVLVVSAARKDLKTGRDIPM